MSIAKGISGLSPYPIIDGHEEALEKFTYPNSAHIYHTCAKSNIILTNVCLFFSSYLTILADVTAIRTEDM